MQPPPTPRTPPVIGRYRVLRLLGQGAMGRVLLAEDTVLGREVAVKSSATTWASRRRCATRSSTG